MIEIRRTYAGEEFAKVRAIAIRLMSREVVVAVSGGKLDVGPWEQIFYGEFDGGRKKRALIKIIGD